MIIFYIGYAMDDTRMEYRPGYTAYMWNSGDRRCRIRITSEGTIWYTDSSGCRPRHSPLREPPCEIVYIWPPPSHEKA